MEGKHSLLVTSRCLLLTSSQTNAIFTLARKARAIVVNELLFIKFWCEKKFINLTFIVRKFKRAFALEHKSL